MVGFVVSPTVAIGPVDAAVTTDLVAIGAAPHLPHGAVRVGTLESNRQITIGVALAVRRPEILAQAAAAAATDPIHGPRLTPAQFDATYGPSDGVAQRVSAALSAMGLHPGRPSENGLLIPVTATVSRIDRAFGSRIDAVRLSSGSVGWAPEGAPLLPAAVASEVTAVIGLTNLISSHSHITPSHAHIIERRSVVTHSAIGAVKPSRSTIVPRACVAASDAAASGGGWTDDQIAKAYGVDHLYARGDVAAGQTVAIFELEPFALSDVARFDKCYFGKSHASQISTKELDGFSLTGQGNGEATLDIENVSALAPAAKIIVYESPNTSFGAVDEYNTIVSQDAANIVSTSWGECESALDAAAPGVRGLENVIFEEAALQGQTVVAASGDDGSDDCANTPFGSSTPVKPYLSVDDPASQPFVLGVGGTALNSIHQPLTARDETVWNVGSNDGAGGGGVSLNWPSPTWQSQSGVPGVTVSRSRQVPDVSASADQSRGITVFSAHSPPPRSSTPENVPPNGIGWSTIGGTSSSAPIWAAILAEIAASGPVGTSCSHLPTTAGGTDLGFVPPNLYAVARVDYGGAFHDVSRGNNDIFGLGNGYAASVGYNLASGLGSPIVVGTKGLRGLASDLCAVSSGSAPTLPAQPIVTSLNPATGSIAGGNQVSIGLASPIPSGVTVTVQFGQTKATVVSASGSSVVVAAPASSGSPDAPSFGGAGPAAVAVAFSGVSGLATSFPTSRARYQYVSTSQGGDVIPTVTGIGPTGGPPGSTPVVIYGSGFASSPITVTIGGVPASGVVVVSDHEINATTPPLSTGTACAIGSGFDPANDCQTQVVVTNASGSSPTATILPPLTGPIVFTPQGNVTQEPGSQIAPTATEFDYSPVPVITSVTPNPAAAEGTSPVTINGVGFSLDTFDWVNFGPASSPDSQQLRILSISSSTISIDPPPARVSNGGSVGGGVSVSSSAGVSNVVPFGYAGIPVVTKLSTHVGPTIGGTRVRVTGHNFTGVNSVNFVSALSVTRFGKSTTSQVTIRDGSHLTVVAPAGLVGPVDIEPCTPSGCAAAHEPRDLFEFFSIAKPQVTSSSPTTGSASGGDVVTIRGNNLAGAVAVYFGGRATSSFANANGFAPGAPDAIAVQAPAGRQGTKVPIIVVTRSGRTVAVARATYTYT